VLQDGTVLALRLEYASGGARDAVVEWPDGRRWTCWCPTWETAAWDAVAEFAAQGHQVAEVRADPRCPLHSPTSPHGETADDPATDFATLRAAVREYLAALDALNVASGHIVSLARRRLFDSDSAVVARRLDRAAERLARLMEDNNE